MLMIVNRCWEESGAQPAEGREGEVEQSILGIMSLLTHESVTAADVLCGSGPGLHS